MSLNSQKLIIEIPETNPKIFEKDYIDNVPKINKKNIKRAKFHFWLDNENENENEKTINQTKK